MCLLLSQYLEEEHGDIIISLHFCLEHTTYESLVKFCELLMASFYFMAFFAKKIVEKSKHLCSFVLA